LTTYDFYVTSPGHSTWDVEVTGAARFNWEYNEGRDRLLALYQKGKDKQWDAVKRIEWDLEVDPFDPLGVPDESISIYGSRYWAKLNERERQEVRKHSAAWQFSQFLHGEQGAMICASRLVESVPDLDSKYYAATQTMDEARHAEIYARFLQEKVGLVYPMNDQLRTLLGDTLRDSRWDMPYLGMQVLIEGLALAAFGFLRDITTKPLPKQILTYIMQDEARHVAFGRMALRDYYNQLSEAELREREEFVIEGSHLLQDRLSGFEVWDHFGWDRKEMIQITSENPHVRAFRSLLFMRVVPCVRDIGLWSARVQQAYADMGVLDMARHRLDDLMRSDEEVAEKMDADRFSAEEAERKAEVDAIVELGSGD